MHACMYHFSLKWLHRVFLSACWRTVCVCVGVSVGGHPPPWCHEHVPVKLVKHHLHLHHQEPESSSHLCLPPYHICFSHIVVSQSRYVSVTVSLCHSMTQIPVAFRTNCSIHRQVSECIMWLRWSTCSERSITLLAKAIRSLLGESERERHRGDVSMSVKLEATGIYTT